MDDEGTMSRPAEERPTQMEPDQLRSAAPVSRRAGVPAVMSRSPEEVRAAPGVRHEAADAPASAPRRRVTANLFGIALGFAGVSQCWTVARQDGAVPGWTVSVAWCLTALAWVGVLTAYLVNTIQRHRLLREPADPTFGPFTSLAFLVPTMLAVPLAEHAPDLGRDVFLAGIVLTAGYGGLLTGQWIVSDLRLEQLHPGYFLPTVATGLVAAAASESMGYHSLAIVMFGYGSLCWVALGSILWARLFLAPPLPPGIVPTMAIEVAPPVVAGSAWFALNHGRVDGVALFLAGYAVLMVLVQLRLVPVYARLSFSPGWWAFSFSYAAAFADGMRWLVVTDVGHRGVLLDLMLIVVTGAVAALAVRTAIGLTRGTFLIREPAG